MIALKRTLGFATIVCCLFLMTQTQLHAQLKTSSAELLQRLNDVCAMMAKKPIQFDTLFASEFLQQVSEEQLKAVITQISAGTGDCASIRIEKLKNNYSASAEITTSKNFVIPVDISIQGQAPYRIAGLFLRPPVQRTTSFAEIIKSLSELPGKTSICIKNISSNTTILAKDTNEYLPLGSAFKLYILGELTRSIAANEHQWHQVISLDSTWKSFPSGVLQNWPHGSPVTLHTLATEMISISDNTATDHLLYSLQRDKVEKMQAVMGHSNAQLNIPFLSTAELFKLKFSNKAKYAHQYALATVQERFALVKDVLPTISRSEVEYAEYPVLPDSLEWFARTTDACRAMQWFYTQRSTVAGKTALDILSVSKGIDINKSAFEYAGFKGGSETGVINLTFLLKRVDGEWFTVSASWLNSTQAVNDITFVSIVSSAVKLLEK